MRTETQGYRIQDAKETHEIGKLQMEKLKNARKNAKRAYFSSSEPDKFYINSKYVKM